MVTDGRESVLDAVRRLGPGLPELSASSGGTDCRETFTLNYVPERIGESLTSVRRAMEASGGRMTLLRYAIRGGFTPGRCSLSLFLAIRQLLSERCGKMNFTVGSECDSGKEPAPPGGCEGAWVAQLVAADIPLRRKRLPPRSHCGIHRQRADGSGPSSAWRKVPYFDVYTYGDYLDYFGRWASTGYLSVWDMGD